MNSISTRHHYTTHMTMNTEQEKEQQSILTTAYRDFGGRLNSHAFYKTSDRAIGEDLVQDTFVKTWAYLVKGGKIEMMKAFLYHVLNNLIVDQYRKRKVTSLDLLVEKGLEPSSDQSQSLFDVLDGKAAILLIKRLPEKFQKIMRMRYVQELSLKEMALITGQSRNTVAVQAHRGLQQLKLLYKSV